ncbi:hypothetical protein ACE3H7_11490 [Listeria monocytogenes]|uniref:hypothetical protein n=1 Tax=Listeria monocytogenes TaxID=1639 RepID=UPI0006C7A467|nr:hypothetical protein [Listeria monocytogenes]EHW1527949.1 hypothetical protein [Listeria monocytogenes]EIA4325048.1 hypothetical protein [Listeria monocytogenes]EIF2811873.1 hypothetical protein [Listeria monocytogenes]EII2589292.1 hypothetical protein [Listeria monocytogenes]EIP8489162.1 hypothetical protein [Listeria monocytogenes]
MNINNTIEICRLKKMLQFQLEKRNELDFQIEILKRLIDESYEKGLAETQQWLAERDEVQT